MKYKQKNKKKVRRLDFTPVYETTKDKHDDNKSKYQLPQITVALLMNTFIMLLKENDEELEQICGECLA